MEVILFGCIYVVFVDYWFFVVYGFFWRLIWMFEGVDGWE